MTRKADIRGACNMTPPTIYFSARKQEGPDPILLPYNIILLAGILIISVKYKYTVSISSYRLYSIGILPLASPNPVYSYTTALTFTAFKKNV